jgi:hypothetical protein
MSKQTDPRAIWPLEHERADLAGQYDADGVHVLERKGAKIEELHNAWFDTGVPLVIELAV